MIYSKWKPSTGGYDYFQGGDKDIPLGNDLPTPALPKGTDIGVASTVAGRPMPPGSKAAGSGAQARGLIVPLESSALSGISNAVPPYYLGAAVGVFLGWIVFTNRVKL